MITFVVAQILGLFAAICQTVSVQFKNKQTILIFIIIDSILFAISFLLLQAWSGSMLCLLMIVPTVAVYLFENKKDDLPTWSIAAFILMTIVVCALTYKIPMDSLTGIASILFIASLVQKNENHIRWILLASVLCWMVYDFAFMAYTPLINDIFFIISDVIAIFRFKANPVSIDNMELEEVYCSDEA